VRQALAQARIDGKWRRFVEEGFELEVGGDTVLTQQRRALFEHRRFGGVAADRRDQ